MAVRRSIDSLRRRVAHGLATVAFGLCGSGLGRDETPPIKFHDKLGLLPNPAYRVRTRRNMTTLVSNAGRKDESRYALDRYSLALWKALQTALPRHEERESPPAPEGLTAPELIKMMCKQFPERRPGMIEKRVREFLIMALTEGIVIPADTRVGFGDTAGGQYIEYEPPAESGGDE